MTIRPPMIHFRLPADLKAWVEQRAEAEGRSVNATLVMMLELVRAEYEADQMKEQADEAEKESEALRVALEALRIAKETQSALQQGIAKGLEAEE